MLYLPRLIICTEVLHQTKYQTNLLRKMNNLPSQTSLTHAKMSKNSILYQNVSIKFVKIRIFYVICHFCNHLPKPPLISIGFVVDYFGSQW